MAVPRKWILVTALVAVVVIATTVTAVMLLQPGGPQVVKIGWHGPLTGPGAADGSSSLESARIAVDEINSEGGINGVPLQLVPYDDAAQSEQATAVADKLITLDQVHAAVSGSYSGPTRVASPKFQEAGIPYISAYATHPEITQAGDMVFRTGMLGPVQGRVVAHTVVNILGHDSAALLVGDWDFPQGILQGIQAHAGEVGLEIKTVETFSIGDSDFSAQLTNIRDNFQPFDVLVVAGLYFHAPAVAQARDLGLDQPVVGVEGFDSPSFIEIGGSAVEGVIITTSLNRDDDRQWVQDFMTTYRDRTGRPADMVGAMTYDAIRMLATAMRSNGIGADQIRSGLASLENFEMTAGTMKSFTEGGEIIKPIWLQQVQNGEFHVYPGHTEPISAESLITPSQ